MGKIIAFLHSTFESDSDSDHRECCGTVHLIFNIMIDLQSWYCNLDSHLHRLNVPILKEGKLLWGRVSLQRNVRIETCDHTWWCGYNVWLENRKQVKRSSTPWICSDQDFSLRYETQTLIMAESHWGCFHFVFFKSSIIRCVLLAMGGWSVTIRRCCPPTREYRPGLHIYKEDVCCWRPAV